ncbi:MAG: hypothetical protein QOG52_2598 [Frankiaceae bacterium]|jgi:prepilin-type N-terminal cleavage/methylation domain-containing protein|nr:hypothetical protein [Frankiaceae bacterium]
MRRGDSGFTLAELLVSITIIGVVMGVMGQAIRMGYSTFSQTDQMLRDSHGKQMLAAYFTRDVQDATTADTTSGTCVPVGETKIVALPGIDISGAAQVVVYSFDGPGQTLYRHACTGAVDDPYIVARSVTSVTLTCLSATYTAGPCNSAPVVRLTVATTSGSFDEDGRRRS